MTVVPSFRLLLVGILLDPTAAFLVDPRSMLGGNHQCSLVPDATISSRTATKRHVHATVIAPCSTLPTSVMGEYYDGDTIKLDHIHPERKQSTPTKNEEEDDDILENLCGLLGGSPIDLLQFQSTAEDGVRGVYLTYPVENNGEILRLPLESCLQDASPPSWMTWDNVNEEEEEDNHDSSTYHSVDWATRLAACLLNLQLTTVQSAEDGRSLWLSLLPDAEYLRASLPVHWPEETVESARSTSLELAVDSAYFGRAEAVEDLVQALKLNSGLVSELDDEAIRRLCHNALDVVQTRSCRVTGADNDDNNNNDGKAPMRVLAPIFDFINHGSIKVRGETGANAQFQREGDDLVVRALADLRAGEEVLIDYGDSARPAWRCLLSYGFVPQYSPIPGPHEDATVDSADEDNEAEVFMDGTRYIVGPSQVPFDMVVAAFESDNPIGGVDDGDEVSLTPRVALKLANRISDVSYHLLLEQERDMHDDDDATRATPFDNISNREAAALRWSQHRVLLACALGLREFAAENRKLAV
jgi:SET domain